MDSGRWRLTTRIPAWARRHHVDVPWMLEAARNARAFWGEFRHGATVPPTCWPPVDTGQLGVWMGNTWLPDAEREKLDPSDHRHPSQMDATQALRSLDHHGPIPRPRERPASYRKRVRTYEAARARAFGETPLVRRTKVDPDHLRWVVRRVVLRETYAAIGGAAWWQGAKPVRNRARYVRAVVGRYGAALGFAVVARGAE